MDISLDPHLNEPWIPDPATVQTDWGFGFSCAAESYHRSITSPDDIQRAFTDAKSSGRKLVLRGNGRSYGDVSLLPEAISLDLTRWNAVESLDKETGILVARGGARLEDVWRFALPDGWWLPVVSGTMLTTVAGGISANIHGKNNCQAGTFGEHLDWLEIVSPGRGTERIHPDHPDFWTIVGGWGQLGFITRAAIRMKRLTSGSVLVTDYPVETWDDLFALFEDDTDSEYQVAWMDGFRSGRGIYTNAKSIAADEPASLRTAYQVPSDRMAFGIRKDQAYKFLRWFTNRPGMRFLSGLKWHATVKRPGDGGRMLPLVAYHFPLDFVPEWQRAYRPGALIQFQVGIPRESAALAFPAFLRAAKLAKIEPYLVVVKRHRPDASVLSYLCDGYSIALDFHQTSRNRERLQKLLRDLTDLSFSHGGKFYLAKDSFLLPADAEKTFGAEAIQRFREAKARFDPDQLITSSLFRRLEIADRA